MGDRFYRDDTFDNYSLTWPLRQLWQCDALGNVTSLTRWRSWQCDALGNVTTPWQCNAIGNVTPLTMWHNWQGDPRDSGDTFLQKMTSLPGIPSIYWLHNIDSIRVRWLTYETFNYWQCTLVLTHYFNEAEFTCWLWLKLRSINKVCAGPGQCSLPPPLLWPTSGFGVHK